MIRGVFLFLAAVLAFPARPENAAARFPVFAKPMLLGAHRGGRALWPENTVVAFRACAERWPDILLEGDLHLTADGHVVVLHDATVDRTTDGAGPVAGMTLEQVKQLDAGYRFTPDDGATFPWRGKGVTVPTLEEALQAAPEHRFIFEMKDGREIADATAAVLRRLDAEDRVILGSFTEAYVTRLRNLAPRVATCFHMPGAMRLVSAMRNGGWAEYEPTAPMLSVPDDLESRFGVSAEDVARIRERGVCYQVHTINDPEAMRAYIKKGADSILTDNPELLARVISETPPDTTASE